MEQDGRKRDAESQGRGDTVTGVKVRGRRVAFASARGFTLIELVMTITVMTILTLGVIPLMKVSVKRQKEQQLRDALRQMRIAIDEFHRDTVGMPTTGLEGAIRPPQQQQQTPIDPRSRVVISDATIFGVDNPDRYPPDLETLVSGVNVIPRGGSLGGRGVQGVNATEVGNSELSTKKKVYLRAIPIDPMTGKADWDLRSCYDAADAGSWGGENVFDVRSKSKEMALNGEKYSDW
ncbi:MAG TPA: type II secretion system protein [Pyrinomonadaceae bacterium]|nr:type II secretion system protein [Pyrinomonadaceae bacterium]